MLIDLARNDLGRVCEFGSVTVDDLMVIECYSHVMHIVSGVSGEVSPGNGPVDVVRATFPHGTVSGAPKVRAIEIIDTLEPVARGPYAGAVGYLDFSGNVDTPIDRLHDLPEEIDADRTVDGHEVAVSRGVPSSPIGPHGPRRDRPVRSLATSPEPGVT